MSLIRFPQVNAQPYLYPFDGDFTVANSAVLCLGMQQAYLACRKGASIAQQALTVISILRQQGVLDIWSQSPGGGACLAPFTPGLRIPLVKENAFFKTDLAQMLMVRGIKNLIIVGFFTDDLVHSSTRAATDWGFECLTIADACQASQPEFQQPQLRITQFGNGLFGTVSSAEALLAAMQFTGDNNAC